MIITVGSLDELVDAGINAALNEIDLSGIEIKKDFTVQIRVTGPTWDGTIDYRGAAYVTGLQKAINEIYRAYIDKDVKDKILNDIVTVRVKVKDGSAFYEIFLDRFFSIIAPRVESMTGTEILIGVAICVGVPAAAWTYVKIAKIREEVKEKIKLKELELQHYLTTAKDQAENELKRKEQELESARQKAENDKYIKEKELELEKYKLESTLKIEELDQNYHTHVAELNQKIQSKLIEAVDRAESVVVDNDLEAPPRKFVKTMDSEDTVHFSGSEEITAKEARQLFPPKPAPISKQDIFDAKYQILGIDIEKVPAVFILKYGSYKFRASAQLSGKSIDEITEKLKNPLGTGADLFMNLRVFIVYTDKKIQDASVTDIGKPRKDSKNIEDLIEKLL